MGTDLDQMPEFNDEGEFSLAQERSVKYVPGLAANYVKHIQRVREEFVMREGDLPNFMLQTIDEIARKNGVAPEWLQSQYDSLMANEGEAVVLAKGCGLGKTEFINVISASKIIPTNFIHATGDIDFLKEDMSERRFKAVKEINPLRSVHKPGKAPRDVKTKRKTARKARAKHRK